MPNTALSVSELLSSDRADGRHERWRRATKLSFNAEGAIRVERWWRLQAVYPKVTKEETGADGGEDRTYGSSGGKGVWPDSGRTDKSELGATTNTLIRS